MMGGTPAASRLSSRPISSPVASRSSKSSMIVPDHVYCRGHGHVLAQFILLAPMLRRAIRAVQNDLHPAKECYTVVFKKSRRRASPFHPP